MTIAQFAESHPPVVNGAAVAVALLSDELRSLGHGVVTYAPRYRGHADPPHVRRFPSYTVPGHSDYPLAIPVSPTLFAEFRREPPRVVHTHSPFALGRCGLGWARRTGVPVVTTYHTLYVEYAHYARGLPVGLVRRWLERVSRRYCNLCDEVVVPSEPIRDVLLSYGVRKPLTVIPTGLRLSPPLARDPAFPRGALGIPAEATVVLYAGRIAREKNLAFLLTAFDRAADEARDAWLLLIGGGPAESETREAVGRLRNRERVVLGGKVSPDRMQAVYAGCDLFAFASLTDTQGLVLTEAKAAGLPAVAVGLYGPATVVRQEEDGLLTAPEVNEFSTALRRLLQDRDLRRRMSQTAVRNAAGYSIRATAEAYLGVYEAACRS